MSDRIRQSRSIYQPHWSEIVCDYCDDENFWTVDAWRTDNDDEEGKVIAYIDSLTGRVIYIDPLARVDANAQEVIQEKVKEVKASAPVRFAMANGTYSVMVDTPAGVLTTDIERKEELGNGRDSAYISIKTKAGDIVDLAAVFVKENGKKQIPSAKDWYIEQLLFEDVMSEEETYGNAITDKEFEELNNPD